MNRPYMIGYSAVIRDNPCDCPFSVTTRSEHHPLVFLSHTTALRRNGYIKVRLWVRIFCNVRRNPETKAQPTIG